MESPFNLLKPGFVEKDVIHSQYRETVATLGIKATKCKKVSWLVLTDIVKLILNQRIFFKLN